MAIERRAPGAIRDAIIQVFKDKRRPLKLDELRASVNELLGEDIPPSSIRSYVRLNTPGRFERVGRGQYRLLR